MVRLSFIAVSALAVASIFAPSVQACEGECKIYPTKFLYQRYLPMVRQGLASLPAQDRNRVEPALRQALSQLRGDDGVIANAIFSRFHKNCHDKPPRRSPDEVCGSAKSIACFAAWDHDQSIFQSVHEAVVGTLETALRDERGNAAVQQALVTDIQNACPGQCESWVQPFQTLMLKWEQREHYNIYGNRTPNCSKGRLAY
ncbi:hypothetical protein BGZ94_009955 [Podila epigama]|nr:hypothetical protein BGZ94_009955 [Podila epigama]